jgi:hypothetical protein
MVSILEEELDLNCHHLSSSRDIIHCSNTILHEQYPLPAAALHEYSFHLQYNHHLRNVK